VRPACDIQQVLVTVNYRDDILGILLEALSPAEVILASHEDSGAIAHALETVDVAILRSDLDDRHLRAPKLRWIHCDHSGLNGSARGEVFERGLIVTGSAGRAATSLAQHVFYFALGLIYNAPGLEEMKRRREWGAVVDFSERRGLIGRTMGIIGLGWTGLETAKLAKAFGMKVLAYRRTATETPNDVDRLYCAARGETFDPLLSDSDVVVLTVGLNNATRRMIGSRELSLIKRSAFLINMARGPVVDEAALVDALHRGSIAGAGLDVFEQEPLPASAPIWRAPNVMITPHATAEVPDLQANSVAIICENIARYRAGRQLLNELGPDDVYSR
jgi:phosphoglycerate dehydrogenase-like enzyme